MTILLTPEEEDDPDLFFLGDDTEAADEEVRRGAGSPLDSDNGGNDGLLLTGEDDDVPRSIDPGLGTSDKIFRFTVRAIGIFVLITTGAIGIFLGYQAIPTLNHYGWDFFTQQKWLPERDVVGIAAAVVGTVQVALVALVVAFPVALFTALFVSEYCPVRLKSILVGVIDLMAAIPSLIYGMWGLLVLGPELTNVARWLDQNVQWIPMFRTGGDPNAAVWFQKNYVGSAFIAGIIVGIMVVPTACSVMRGVFAIAPIGEREAAYALGSTRWGMIRSVVLPFGRGGIVGGTMLSLGRALGETVAVLLVISAAYDIKIELILNGTMTVSALIANFFGEASGRQLQALLAAGFILFVLTLAVNTLAAIVVNRSRSGAGTDI